jgi:hypothetical protein
MTTLRITHAMLLTLALVACGSDNADPPPNPPDDNTPPLVEEPIAQNRDVDSSQAPGADAADTGPGPLGATVVLRSNQIRTRYLIDGAVTAGKIAFLAKTVTVAMSATTGSSAADPLLAGGVLVACTPAGNQDQFIDNAVLNGDGSITVTLAAAATAANTIRCVAWKANAFGIN